MLQVKFDLYTNLRRPHIKCTGFTYAVPSLPPQNVSSYNTSSTSLHVSWHKVPHGFVHGILLGYRVLYKVAGGISNNSVVSTSGTTKQKELQGLKKFTIYEITVLAFTRIGDGANSISMFVSTDEDSKSQNNLPLTCENITGPLSNAISGIRPTFKPP